MIERMERDLDLDHARERCCGVLAVCRPPRFQTRRTNPIPSAQPGEKRRFDDGRPAGWAPVHACMQTCRHGLFSLGAWMEEAAELEMMMDVV